MMVAVCSRICQNSDGEAITIRVSGAISVATSPPCGIFAMIRFTALFVAMLGSVAGPLYAQGVPGPGTYNGKGADYWIGQLEDEDYLVRLRAAYALGQIVPPTRAAVPRLTELLLDNRLEVRSYALHALGRMGPVAEGAVPAIVTSIEDTHNDWYVLHCAAEALGRIGPVAKAAEPVLLKALKSEDLTYRVKAATALWKISRYEAALPALLGVLRTGKGDAAYQAAMALLEFGPEARSALPDLIAALRSSDPDVRRAAVKVIGALGPGAAPPLARAIKNDQAVDRRAAADALGLLLGEVREKVFYNPATSEEQFREVEYALRRDVVPVLGELLNHDDPEVRMSAGRALARMGPSTAPALLAATRVNNVRFRRAAFDALIRLGAYLPQGTPASPGLEYVKREAVPELIKTLQHDDEEVRVAALRVFVALEIGSDGPQVERLLRPFLRHDDPRVRSAAARALKNLKQDASHLKSTNASTREE
jgi:HEAT repeat protein